MCVLFWYKIESTVVFILNIMFFFSQNHKFFCLVLKYIRHKQWNHVKVIDSTISRMKCIFFRSRFQFQSVYLTIHISRKGLNKVKANITRKGSDMSGFGPFHVINVLLVYFSFRYNFVNWVILRLKFLMFVRSYIDSSIVTKIFNKCYICGQ